MRGGGLIAGAGAAALFCALAAPTAAAATPEPVPPAGVAVKSSVTADPLTVLGDTPDPQGDRVVAVIDTGGTLEVRSWDTASVPEAVDAVRGAQRTPGVVAVGTDHALRVMDPPGVAATVATTAAGSCLDLRSLQQQGDTAMPWQYGQATSAVVAVIDTGVDAAHPDLAGRVLPGVNLYSDPLLGGARDGARDGRQDGNGHGTGVAGVISGVDDSCGISGLSSAPILPIRVLGDDGSGRESDVYAGLLWAVDHGADIVNLSLGGGHYDEVGQAAVDYANAHGVAVVAAAGNEGASGSPPNFPASYVGATAVAAVDSQGKRAVFSTAGDFVDVAAPGAGVITAWSGGSWVKVSGTSFSAPHIAGAAAAVLPKLRQTDAAASGLAATRYVVGAADGHYSTSGAEPRGWRPDLGWGVPQFARVMTGQSTTPGAGTYHLTGDVPDPYTAVPALPWAPTAVAATPGPGSIAVTWEQPVYEGTSPVSSYAVQVASTTTTAGGGCTTSGDPAATGQFSCTVAGLTPGQAYRVSVAATNKAGEGPSAAPAAPVELAPVPVAAADVSVIPGNGALLVSWRREAQSGVTYRATATAAGGGALGSCSVTDDVFCIIRNLGNATAHTVSVVASSSSGSAAATEVPDFAVPRGRCTPVSTAPVSPAFKAAIESRFASGDLVFRALFTAELQRQVQCNAELRQNLYDAISAQIAADPNGPTARVMREAILRQVAVQNELARNPDGDTARIVRAALGIL